MLTKEYRDSLIKQLDAMQGEVAMYYKNMVTGEEFRYHENDELQPASVIKLPVFLHYLELAAAGKIDPKEEILCTDADRVGGCGALRAFHGDQMVSLETLWELMITLSDNCATNLLINHLGKEEFQKAFPEMGLHVTKLRRIMFDSVLAAQGIEMTGDELKDLSAGILSRVYDCVQVRQSIDVEHHILGAVNDAAGRLEGGRQQVFGVVVDHAVLALGNVDIRPVFVNLRGRGGIRVHGGIGIGVDQGAVGAAEDDFGSALDTRDDDAGQYHREDRHTEQPCNFLFHTGAQHSFRQAFRAVILHHSGRKFNKKQ